MAMAREGWGFLRADLAGKSRHWMDEYLFTQCIGDQHLDRRGDTHVGTRGLHIAARRIRRSLLRHHAVGCSLSVERSPGCVDLPARMGHSRSAKPVVRTVA